MKWNVTAIATVVILAGLALVPVAAHAIGDLFYVTLFSRILIFALAGVGLNLLLGYGGMVSFGHALYVAIGAYSVGILSVSGITSGWIQLSCGLAFGGVVSIIIGLICLRTTGMTFIMITLAFAQMFYFVAVGLKRFGGDEGISLPARSLLPPFDLHHNIVLYYTILTVLVAVLWGLQRILSSRFGLALRGTKLNQVRMRSLGFQTLRVQLIAYVLSALICVIAGFFLANLTRFVSPSYVHWSISGELIVIVVLGGMGTLIGPVLGAIALISLEELLTSGLLHLPGAGDAFVHRHWKLLLGIFIVGVAIFLQKGLYGIIVGRRTAP